MAVTPSAAAPQETRTPILLSDGTVVLQVARQVSLLLTRDELADLAANAIAALALAESAQS